MSFSWFGFLFEPKFLLFLKLLNLVVKAWSSYLFWGFSFSMILDSYWAQKVRSSSNVGYSFLVFMLAENASHILGRPLSTLFTNSFSEMISSIAYSWSLNWDILTKYDVMLSSSFIFMSQSLFFKFITCPMFLNEKRLVRASYIFFD